LNRVWRLVTESIEILQGVNLPAEYKELDPDAKALRFKTHATIKKVTDDIETRFNFNTAISAIMELTNAINAYRDQEEQDLCVLKEAVQTLLVLLCPFSPHITEELWSIMGYQTSIHLQSWPAYDPEALVQDEIEIVLQISGKVRDRIMVPAQASEDDLRAIALDNPKIKELTKGQNIVKIIVVPGKLVNVVAKP
ncbi:MAG TPA: class I tRNA ligase family protein, partial [Syntrophomonadaceae bacterium]|nr:class I tRNA ligase family protein [Syntrophomonadaceae bacterium]